MRKKSLHVLMGAVAIAIGLSLVTAGLAWAVNPGAPPPLKTIAVPEPPNLGLFLRAYPNITTSAGFPKPTAEARKAAIELGKALFWDMQVGSDGIQACASCHFHAGADSRVKGELSPGLKGGDNTFQVSGANAVLTPGMFPFTRFADPEDRFSQMLSDANDVVSSMGVHMTSFTALPVKGSVDTGDIIPDPVFNAGGFNVRRVEPRNAPTVINAVFNFANFWDGRANNIFNGSSPFGDADPNAGVFVNVSGVLKKVRVKISMGSLASQAVGPPVSDFEMSFAGRTWPDIGKKMLGLVPLGKQKVAKTDSVLGPLSKGKGLNTTYDALIRAAFQDKYWDSAQAVSFAAGAAVTVNDLGRKLTISPGAHTVLAKSSEGALAANEYTQMQANFALFFGLAVQMYEATLVSDDSPFDRFQAGDNTAMSDSAKSGLNIFLTDAADPLNPGGSCIFCHGEPVFTNASVSHIGSTFFGTEVLPEALIERMFAADGNGAFYDTGYYDIGVRPIDDDIARGGSDPFGYPLSFTERALLMDNGVALPFANPTLPCGAGQPVPCTLQRPVTRGSFKVPTLRNVELTGPYYHNGGKSTLGQVVDFYSFAGYQLAGLAELIIVGAKDNWHAIHRSLGHIVYTHTEPTADISHLTVTIDGREHSEAVDNETIRRRDILLRSCRVTYMWALQFGNDSCQMLFVYLVGGDDQLHLRVIVEVFDENVFVFGPGAARHQCKPVRKLFHQRQRFGQIHNVHHTVEAGIPTDGHVRYPNRCQ